MTVAACARRGVEVLVAAGFSSEDASRDVGVLVRHLLGWDSAEWIVRRHDEAPPTLAARLEALIGRRTHGEPVAYLLGTREFWGRTFMVTSDVLVPRPETEGLVERVLASLAAPRRHASPLIVDVGTGSGNLAITLAAECPDARVVATDTSAAALDVARENARRHGVANRVTFVHAALTADTDGADVVVSNPPYIPDGDRAHLMRDVRDFEPAPALFGGPDGLDVVRRLVPDAFAHLSPGGVLLIEIGEGQASAVEALYSRTGYESVYTTRDLAGIPRIVEGRRPGASV